MKNFKVIILAAGEGTRMKSKMPKVLHKVMNKSMLQRVIDVSKKAGAQDIMVIVGHKADDVKNSVKDQDIKFAIQAEQLGTGHAVMQAGEFIDTNADIVILYGDTPLTKVETIEKLVEFHQKEDNGVSIISAIVEDSTGYGHIVRDENSSFLRNVEYKDCNEEEKLIKEINTGTYCFKGNALKEALSLIKNNNSQGEYYLPDTLEIILQSGGKVECMVADDVTEFYGVNSRVQLAKAEEILKNRINNFHMENGVTIIDPNQTYIEDTVKIGCDTIIYPGCVLEGNCEIAEDVILGPYSRLTNMKIGSGTKVEFSTATNSEVGKNTTVGPYAYIRPNSKVGDKVKVGDFVEVKNSVIGNGTKISHLTYVGDSDVGEGVNFGCGTVTVNYDGTNKFRTIVEDNVFIGCNANLVAPVTLKTGSYVAAGSTITKDVPKKSLAVARERQVNLEGWTKK